jgi:hypothetical protein
MYYIIKGAAGFHVVLPSCSPGPFAPYMYKCESLI